MFKTQLYSQKLANAHFWIGTIGILFYALPLYWAGFTQYLMWQEFTPDGFLAYPNFLETVTQILPMYAMRSLGGTLYFTGVILMVVNIWKTVKAGSFEANEAAEAPALEKEYFAGLGEHWHRPIERKPVRLLIFALIVILIGGAVEMMPTFLVKSNIPTIEAVKPYTPLELQGRDIYIKEGCNNCHTQMVRPFRHEVERFGEYSKSGEDVYNHPHLWGSKRTGPDLAREGSKKLRKSHSWHYNHMFDPTTMSPGSVMPRYPWLMFKDIDVKSTTSKMAVMQKLGVPYTDEEIKAGKADLMAQAEQITAELKEQGVKEADAKKEIIALIAYLQRLGTDIEKTTEK
jgi:cytochrome c oxidase cbb3-type subunit I/II